MTHEEKLKRVIKAQVKGGYGEYFYITEYDENDDWEGLWEHILNILLDTQGLRAAYGEETAYETVRNVNGDIKIMHDNWRLASHQILDAWHSGEGNNYKEAISVAHSLLQ